MKKKDVSINCLPFWILESEVFTLFVEVWKIQKKPANVILEMFLSLYVNILKWVCPHEEKICKVPGSTPLGGQPSLGTQPLYKALSDLRVKNKKMQWWTFSE